MRKVQPADDALETAKAPPRHYPTHPCAAVYHAMHEIVTLLYSPVEDEPHGLRSRMLLRTLNEFTKTFYSSVSHLCKVLRWNHISLDKKPMMLFA